MSRIRLVALALSLSLLAGAALSYQLPDIYDESKRKKKKKKKEDVEPPTQVLALPPDPPAVLTVETRRLAFHVAPLTNKGLLSQQVRDGLRTLFRLTRGNQIVKLRAFVAGTGDLRRVQTIVSETFAEKKMALPVLSVIQVGALPMEGAQVALETISLEKRDVNPEGLAFIAGQQIVSDQPTLDMAPLVAKSIAQIRTAISAIGQEPKDVLRVTCFVSSLADQPQAIQSVTQAFPEAAAHLIQVQRVPSRSLTECESVAALSKPVGLPIKFLNPEGLTTNENYSQVALVSAPRVVLTGTQLAFNQQEDDARLAFQRLEKSLESARASLKSVAMSHVYPLSQKSTELVRKVRFDYMDKSHPPASTLLLFEGLPSLDASFGLDVIAVAP
jgi:enamine deaminase RidA (YjgF/YER057c/UK114 family)